MVSARRPLRNLTFLILGLSLALLGRPVEAHAPGAGTPEPYRGAILCQPGPGGRPESGCTPLGPSAYQDRMARSGVLLPMQPLPARLPDRNLSYVEFNYARVVSQNAPIYASLDDAARQQDPIRRLESGFDFISYRDIVVVNGGRHFQLSSGEWMYGGDLSRITPAVFQGLEFQRMPERPFGWILQQTETKRSPGYETQDYTGHRLNRFDVVQVYATARAGDWDWYLIGPDEWIEQRLIGRVVPNPAPPAGVDNGRWIEINLFEQTVAVYEHQRLVYATLTSSGLPGWWTRPGLFQVYIKLDQDTMRGAFEPDRSDYYYLQDVPWTMYFDESRALHGAYWHNGFGYPRSHGCVNLAIGDARWIFDWARDGDWVYVWDPSGRTPEDPDLYSAGGA